MAFAVAEAADSSFGSARVTELRNGNELPPPATLGAPIEEGFWDMLNTLPPEQMVSWGDRVAVSFEGHPGLWLYESGGWEELTSVSPQHLLVACRSLVASFQGYGLFLYNDQGWVSLNGADPWGVEAFGNERLLVNFGPGVGFWNYECPASTTCAFLDGATWATADVGRDIPLIFEAGIEPPPVEVDVSVIYTTVVGNSLYMSFYEDGFCDEIVEEFELSNDCSFFGYFVDAYPIGPDCSVTEEDWVTGRFTETGINATVNESSTYSGESCPLDTVYEGMAIGAPCPAELCWPCGEKF